MYLILSVELFGMYYTVTVSSFTAASQPIFVSPPEGGLDLVTNRKGAI
jgi:hypothetical protein